MANVDDVIAAFVKLREARKELKKKYSEEDEKLLQKMYKCKAFLLGTMSDTGAEQLGSSHGTAFRQIKRKANCTDWPTYWEWMADNRRFDMLEKRVSLKAINEYNEETGDFPPAINVTSEYDVIVRRK